MAVVKRPRASASNLVRVRVLPGRIVYHGADADGQPVARLEGDVFEVTPEDGHALAATNVVERVR